MVRLFDTARGAVAPLELRDPGKVSMYVCGPTVYGPPHVGHGRMTLVFDVLRRYLAWSGLDVRFVSNITDIDDNIIERARRDGVEPAELARRCEAEWYAAMDALGVARPDADPHATAYVGEMVALVEALMVDDVAYESDDGVYLEAERVPGYGLLARQPLDSLRAGARVEAVAGKRSPVDFALWKKAKPGEPSWPSPWGEGRPGWHTECVVMSLDLLGEGFDIHGGGQDLAFPHHENERAQALASGRRFAGHWVHNGFVEVAGEKMSKSLGNFTDLADLVGWGDPRAYRLLVLQAHYRAPIEVSHQTVGAAGTALARLDSFARRFEAIGAGASDLGADAPDAGAVGADAGALDRFRERMDDDLDTPAATALLFDLVREANSSGSAPAAAAAFTVAGALGLVLRRDPGVVDDEALALARRRDEARARRDWVAADAVRDELAGRGYEVTDTPEGTTLRRRSPDPARRG